MRIYLIRHGQSTSDIEDRYGGDYDDELTSKGVLQTKDAAKSLKSAGIKTVFYSPRIRARQTAITLSETLKVPMEEIMDLRERNNYSVLTGMTKADALSKYPGEVKKFKADSKHHGIRGSEDYDSFKKRVVMAFKDVCSKNVGTIAIVTHGGPMRVIMREFIGSEISSPKDCEIFLIEKKGERFVVA